MDPTKDMLKRYTQDYALDEQTRMKAEELYREYMAKQQRTPNVSYYRQNWKGKNINAYKGDESLINGLYDQYIDQGLESTAIY